MADHDALTGLLNRRSVNRELDSHAALVGRYGPEGALLMLDLDHFKHINDTLGHQAGDEILAMYDAKEAGRSCFSSFDAARDEQPANIVHTAQPTS